MRTGLSVAARARVWVSAGLVLSLVAALVWGLPPARAAAGEPGDGEPVEQPVPTTPLPVQPIPPPQMPQWSAPAAPVWPSAGTATVDLAGSGSSSPFGGRVGVAGSASPGGLPVTVTVPGSGDSVQAEQRLMRGLDAASVPIAVSAVEVSTLDQSAAAGLGVRGVVFTLANAGAAAAAPAPVQVAIHHTRHPESSKKRCPPR